LVASSGNQIARISLRISTVFLQKLLILVCFGNSIFSVFGGHIAAHLPEICSSTALQIIIESRFGILNLDFIFIE
jgi:hypothetical protein